MGSLISNGIGPVFRDSSIKFAEGVIPGIRFNTLNSDPFILFGPIASGVPVLLTMILEADFIQRATVEYYVGQYPYLATFQDKSAIITFALQSISEPGLVQSGVNTRAFELNTTPGAGIVLYSPTDDGAAQFNDCYYKISYYEAVPA